MERPCVMFRPTNTGVDEMGMAALKVLSFRVLGPVVQKPINANPRLKINQGVYFSIAKCCSTLIFGKTLH